MLELLWLPFLACLVLSGIHAYLGLHVLTRGVIFVDLALAQVAALGMTTALFFGYAPQDDAAYYYALAFTVAGAALFALTREHRHGGRVEGIPQEAIIGIVYAVTAALTVLVLDRVAQGGEQIKQLLVGSILAVTSEEVVRVAALYSAIGALHWLCRRPLLAISLGQPAHHIRAWDFLFYLTFGLVVTSSVRIAGVLLVFSYLIVPAVVGAYLASGISRRLIIGWTVAFAVSGLGLGASYLGDLPTGATVVATFGLLLALVGSVRALVAMAAQTRRHGIRALAALALLGGVMIALAGLALAAFPRADHLWLEALEGLVPVVQTFFLTPYERQVRLDSAAAIARNAAELRRLRALQADVQWGTRDLPPEQGERLRQFLQAGDELVAGDRLVLRTLRQHARERQRYAVGIPLIVAGAGLMTVSLRARRPVAPVPVRE
jgi:zinc/manganese transport system permease protein